jgi:hypothetical protein
MARSCAGDPTTLSAAGVHASLPLLSLELAHRDSCGPWLQRRERKSGRRAGGAKQLDEAGLTIREIGAELGISPASVHRILKGHHRLIVDAIPV